MESNELSITSLKLKFPIVGNPQDERLDSDLDKGLVIAKKSSELTIPLQRRGGDFFNSDQGADTHWESTSQTHAAEQFQQPWSLPELKSRAKFVYDSRVRRQAKADLEQGF